MKCYHTYQPPASLVFKLLALVYLGSAVVSPITDCDEVFNYWEPLHYLIHGSGLQTWEYASQYALRSYAYLLAHLPPILAVEGVARLGSLLSTPEWTLVYGQEALIPHALLSTWKAKHTEFYALRYALAVVAAAAMAWLYRSLVRRMPASYVPALAVLGLASAPGMLLAVPAFLPSTTAMVALAAAYAAFLDGDAPRVVPVGLVATAALFAWPFAAWVGIPMALEMTIAGVFKTHETYVSRIGAFAVAAVIAGLALLVPMAAVDSWFFGKPVLAPLNIVMYNVIAAQESGGGSELYGTEPWTYYVVNMFLNLNVLAVAGMAAPLVVLLPNVLTSYVDLVPAPGFRTRLSALLLSIWAWVGLMISQPHKEERFLYPVYPALCVGAAVTVACALTTVTRVLAFVSPPRPKTRSAPSFDTLSSLAWLVLSVFCAVSLALSASRFTSMATGYSAPISLFTELTDSVMSPAARSRLAPDASLTVCIGKEWYRYPSEFFLPDARFSLAFVNASFGGLLPQHFAPYPGGLARLVPNMNDRNQEDTSRYVPLSACDFMVDLVLGPGDDLAAAHPDTWAVAASFPFLYAPESPALARAFYIPFYTPSAAVYKPYTLFQRITQPQ